MKQSLSIIVGLIIVVIISWYAVFNMAENTTVSFIDPQFEQAVKVELKTNKPIEQNDLLGLTSLSLRGIGLTSLEDLHWLENLRELNIRDNHIVDLAPLTSLPYLEKLNIRNNNITDLSPIAELENLRELDARDNHIMSVDPLMNLTKLTILNLRNNRIEDLNPLQNMIYLEELNIRDNQVRDISTLRNFTLLRDVNLRNNQITDFSALEDLEELTERVYVEGNPYESDATLDKLFDRVRDIDFSDPTFRVYISANSGHYEQPVEVILENQWRSGKIYYTVDGSDPTVLSNVYDEQLRITKDTMLRAKFVDQFGQAGEITTRMYNFSK